MPLAIKDLSTVFTQLKIVYHTFIRAQGRLGEDRENRVVIGSSLIERKLIS